MSIPAILRILSSFRRGSGRTRGNLTYALLRAYRPSSRTGNIAKIGSYTRPGPNSFTASTYPERFRPLPFLDRHQTIALETDFHPLRWATGPWVLVYTRGSLRRVPSRDGNGAVLKTHKLGPTCHFLGPNDFRYRLLR